MRLLLTTGLLFAFVGCDDQTAVESSPTPLEAPTPEPAPPAEPLAAEDDESDSPAGPVVEEGAFELRAQAEPQYAVDSDATFAIALTTRAGWHVNEDYPLSVKLTSPEGVEIARDEFTKDDATEFGEEAARFQVPFRAVQPGEHRVEANVDFAVCTPETCVPEERTLSFILPVAGGNP